MPQPKPSIFTIGYQGRSVDQFVGSLVQNSVDTIIDVRLRPNSRKVGFSKTGLAAACSRVGIGYQHDRDLGTPAEILAAFRETGEYDWDGFVTHLDSQPLALNRAIEVASDRVVCLVCYEADPLECHRRFVADRMAAHLDLKRIDI